MTADRDLAAEQDHAEFTGWWEAQGYTDGNFEADSMAEAFAGGMRAARDLAAASQPAELAAAETRQLRAQLAAVLDGFGKASDGYHARVILAREYRGAGLPLPAWLSHLEGQ